MSNKLFSPFCQGKNIVITQFELNFKGIQVEHLHLSHISFDTNVAFMNFGRVNKSKYYF